MEKIVLNTKPQDEVSTERVLYSFEINNS